MNKPSPEPRTQNRVLYVFCPCSVRVLSVFWVWGGLQITKNSPGVTKTAQPSYSLRGVQLFKFEFSLVEARARFCKVCIRKQLPSLQNAHLQNAPGPYETNTFQIRHMISLKTQWNLMKTRISFEK